MVQCHYSNFVWQMFFFKFYSLKIFGTFMRCQIHEQIILSSWSNLQNKWFLNESHWSCSGVQHTDAIIQLTIPTQRYCITWDIACVYFNDTFMVLWVLFEAWKLQSSFILHGNERLGHSLEFSLLVCCAGLKMQQYWSATCSFCKVWQEWIFKWRIIICNHTPI